MVSVGVGVFLALHRGKFRCIDILSRNFPFTAGGYTLMRVGLDIGSTTIKCVVLNDAGEIVFSTYERHFSHILEKGKALLEK